PDQVDLNYANPEVLVEVLDVLLFYIRRGASVLRLDAVPYLWKDPSTPCIHLPQTHTLIRLIRDVLDAVAPHVLLLAEVNAPQAENLQYLGRGGDEAQIIYNFPLAPLILWTLVTGHAGKLTEWATQLRWMGPRATYLNITATHDGIGMRPIEGILDSRAREMLVALGRTRGGDVTGWTDRDGSFVPYELNINYFSALCDPETSEESGVQLERFMLSQTIPMCLMGIPGVYVHSLLGSQNDLEGVLRTGRARSINRQQLQIAQLLGELADPSSLRSRIFSRYCQLLRARQLISAFHPDAGQEVLDLGSEFFTVRRVNGETGEIVIAIHNVTNRPRTVNVSAFCERGEWEDILSGEQLTPSTLESLDMKPYQARWLRKERWLKASGQNRRHQSAS
ncbi:MAG: alpha-amylase family glycosyl hydrolase, partial [Kiritimatiellae bacterium]|nr:alpha-amylase family glycosyl hydrolase [Kiritimatiellia bacterium]